MIQIMIVLVQILGAQKLLQLPQYPRQELLRQLLQLRILILLAVLLTSLMLLLTSLVLLLLLLLLLLLARIPTTLLLLITTLLPIPTLLLLLLLITTRLIPLPIIDMRHIHSTTLQIHIYPPLIRLRMILQPQLPTHLFHPGLDLLHMPRTMISHPHNNMQMRLPRTPCVLYPLLKNILRFLDELPMQIDCVGWDAPLSVVLAEYEFRGLFVVLLHACAVVFAFLREGVRGSAVALCIGLLGAVEGGAAFASFLSRQIAQAVVFLFGGLGLVVVEGWWVRLV